MGKRGLICGCSRLWRWRADPHEAERAEAEVSKRQALLDVKLAGQRLKAVVDHLEREREARD